MNQEAALPLVSVVIPTYQRSERLEAALRTVLSQIYKNIEVIVCDDNTNPIESEKVFSICSSFPQVICIHNSRRKGGSGARNTASLIAKGEFIAFLDDDDYWLPTKLSIQIPYLIDSRFRASFCGAISRHDLFGDSPHVYHSTHFGSSEVFSGFCPLSTSLLVVSRALFHEVGMFDEDLTSFQDFDLYARLTSYTDIQYCPEILVQFIEHTGPRTSIDLTRRFRGLDQILTKWSSDIDAGIGSLAFKKRYISYAYIGNAKATLGHNYLQANLHTLNALRYGRRGRYEFKWFFIVLLGRFFSRELVHARNFMLSIRST